MKRIIIIPFLFAALMIAGCAITTETSSTDTIDRHPDPTFSDLDSYGTWVNVPDYGSVWKPYAENNWQPYSDGQWDWTDQGWMWDSNEPYGWIVYHYGYWQFTDYDGWFWIPGYDWAPARVSWYNSNEYVGWAPLPPPGIGVSVIYNERYENRVWVIVPTANFTRSNVRQYRNRSYDPGVSVLRSNDGGRGPDVSDIARASNRPVNVVQPTREQVNKGKHQLTRVRVQNNNPVSPSTIKNQSNPDKRPDQVNPQKPATNTNEKDSRRQVDVNNQKAASNQPEIYESKPVEINTIQNNTGSNNINSKKSGHHKSGHKKNVTKTVQNTSSTVAPTQPSAPQRAAVQQQAPIEQQAPAQQRAPVQQRTPTPARTNNNNSSQKNDQR